MAQLPCIGLYKPFINLPFGDKLPAMYFDHTQQITGTPPRLLHKQSHCLPNGGWQDLEVASDVRGKQPSQNSFVTHRIHGTGIFPHIWLIFMADVGKYTSPMDCMGKKLRTAWRWREKCEETSYVSISPKPFGRLPPTTNMFPAK